MQDAVFMVYPASVIFTDVATVDALF